MQLMSIPAPSPCCSPRCPQQKRHFPSTFPAKSPTLLLPVYSLKRNRFFPIVFAAKQQQEADKPVKKKSGKRKGGEQSIHTVPLPKPPAGFVLDDHGRVLLASNKRIATIIDAANNLPLECVIRRVFQSSQGDECMLLCPVDTPVQILKSANFNGWSAVSDDEVEAIIPSAAYALAKIHMHLVVSGFCYTARGGFCYSEEDIIEFGTDDSEEIDGLPTEGFEITCFNLLPLLRNLSLDLCDAAQSGFDSPSHSQKLYLSTVKICRCKAQRCAFEVDKAGGFKAVHRETIVLEYTSNQLRTTVVKERI